MRGFGWPKVYGQHSSWFSTILAIILLVVGLWNATLLPSEKGYYAFSFLLALFGAIAVQKNVRDAAQAEKKEGSQEHS